MKRPNVLFIITDQQQAATVRSDHPCQMPNTRRLAAEGLHFDRAYTPCPLCLATRVSMMSGIYPHIHGLIENSNLPGGMLLSLKNSEERSVFSHRPVEGLACFSQLLHEAGYRLAWSGRWHVLPGHHPTELGFESFDYTEAENGALRKSLGLTTTIYSPERITSGYCFQRPGFGTFPLYGKCDEPLQAFVDTDTVNRALGRLETLAAGEAPWFLGVGLLAPHDPYVVPEPYASMYDPDSVELPPSFTDEMLDKPTLYRKQRRIAYADLTEQNYREMIAYYWGFTTYVDDMIGRLLQRLEELGVAEDTLVIFTSDHGDNMGGHGLIYKTLNMFEETLRVPLIARWPAAIQSPGRVCSSLASLLDIAPTMLDLAGVSVPDHYDGRSLLPCFEGRPDDWRQALLVESEGCGANHVTQRVLITDRWKYVYNAFDVDELYDLETDPHELVNLAAANPLQAPLPDMVRALWGELARTNDTSLPRIQPNAMLLPFGPD